MALFIDAKDSTIKVIVSKDAAIINTPDDDYKAYLDDLDESHLTFEDNGLPTRFLMRKILPYKSAIKIKNHQIGVEAGKVKFNASYMNEEVRLSLTGIEQPDVPEEYKDMLIPWKADGAGGAADSVMELLEAAGVVNDLFTARQNSVSSINPELAKKKSPLSLNSVTQTAVP